MLNNYFPLFDFLQIQGEKPYLVGGAVRDLLLNLPSHDLDFVVLGDAVKLARLTANHFHGAFYLMDAEHGIARVMINSSQLPNLILDFSDARGDSLESDLFYRDFTINAIALDLNTQKIIDPFEGSLHLQQKILKICNPESFLQDPIRVLRAMRFSLYLNLHIESETKSLLYQALPYLDKVSGERQRDELYRMLNGGKSAATLRLLHHTGITHQVFPEFETLISEKQTSIENQNLIDLVIKTLQNIDMILNFIEGKRDLIAETLFSNLIYLHLGRFRKQLLEYLQNHLNADRKLRGLICLSAMFFSYIADIQKDKVNPELYSRQIDCITQRLKSFAFSRSEIQHFLCIITHANRFFELCSEHQSNGLKTSELKDQEVHLDHRQIYRYFNDTGKAGIDICLLSLALYGARFGTEIDHKDFAHLLISAGDLFDGYWEHKSDVIDPQPLISGNDVMEALSIPASSEIGQILELIREEQAAGNIISKQQALNFIHTIK